MMVGVRVQDASPPRQLDLGAFARFPHAWATNKALYGVAKLGPKCFAGPSIGELLPSSLLDGERGQIDDTDGELSPKSTAWKAFAFLHTFLHRSFPK